MDVKQQDERELVSFRLNKKLVARMRAVASGPGWPPPPTQTDIVTRGIELVLKELEKRKSL